MIPQNKLDELRQSLEGELSTDHATRLLYATDASAYREMPVAVAVPRNVNDIGKLIAFARLMRTSLIPRTAGTSLAGQVVGGGIVVDISRHFNKVLEINVKEHWVRVEPGVVLDELNILLEPHGLFFGPETSTSNRCMIGGMVGNNSCGSHSLVYGSTRNHTLEVKTLLSNGMEAVFGSISKSEFQEKCLQNDQEGAIYRNIQIILSDPENQKQILAEYPDPDLERRNTGYAIDLLLNTEPFSPEKEAFNFCKLIAGSEGTLAFITEIKLNLVPLPPKEKALLCVHCHTLEDAFYGNMIALAHKPVAIELMDHFILEQTKTNIEQRKNRFFVEGEPGAILIIELAENTKDEISTKVAAIEHDLRQAGYGYHYPLVIGPDISKVWNLRKAGLGLLSNLPMDAKPVAVIEDTAVKPELLPHYMADIKAMLAKYGLFCVYYAHIATGELHLRPVLNLKDPTDVALFRAVALETAKLVKKYKGSLSGEHGDGRLRGEFIPFMIGEHNYALLTTIKQAWDPEGIFNPGKITGTPDMNTSLRYLPGKPVRKIDTIFDFGGKEGMLRAVERCNGSGDCRKTEIIGGTMCPSYMASHDESTTTRARANTLREFLTNSEKENPFNHREVYNSLDLCLSCKGCKSECPSNVDMAKYKAEFLYHWYTSHGIPLRTKLIANIAKINKLGMLFPSIFNFVATNRFTSFMLKKILGFAPVRSIPMLYKFTLKSWVNNFNRLVITEKNSETEFPNGKVYLFADEFTDYNDVEIGMKAVMMLNKLGYKVEIPMHTESGRAYLSKGLVQKAKELAIANVNFLKDCITESTPLIGIEPSAILTFRDEYPDLVGAELKEKALLLCKNCLMFDEFIMREAAEGNICKDLFTTEVQNIRLHGHCHQKALASTGPTKEMLSFPVNYTVDEIKSGCCGMAGSFGYEKEHYELSQKVGELKLFPEVRKTPADTIIAAPGTSCRHQIKDGTGRKALHPIEVLYDALID
jgi:FAD/FMN-containing dehydrogenase/Fe-S oxidoreductase